MKKIKTMLLLAIATGMLAAPAVASGAEWTINGEPIQYLEEPVAIQLEGKSKFAYSYDYVRCDIEAEATLIPGGTGEITKFDFSTCTAGPGYCAFDSFSNDVPWSMYIDEFAMPVIEDMSFGALFESPCPEPFNWGPVDMTGWYDEYEYISTLSFTGNDNGRTMRADLDVEAPGALRIVPTE